jgi:tetratricopeptide (TPR) repeat protein
VIGAGGAGRSGAIVALAIVASGAAALAGCGGSSDAFQSGLAAGERAKSSGRYDEAAAAYGEAATRAKKQRDQDEARYRQASALQEAGRVPEALAAYEALASRPGERAGRAAFDEAFLLIDRGDAAKGWTQIEAALWAHADSGSARRGLHRWLDHLDEQKPGAGLAWLRQNQARLLGTELGEDALYLTAKRIEASGDKAEAREAYVRCALAYPYPQGSLADDAYWNASLLDEQLGRMQDAVTDLRRMVERREVSTLGQGSYERPRYPEAQFRVAVLYRDRLNDPAQARREFHRMFTDFPNSIKRAEALWNEGRLAHKAGDSSGTCEAMTLLSTTFPESRYAACVATLCPSAKPPEKAMACRGYIQDTAAP